MGIEFHAGGGAGKAVVVRKIGNTFAFYVNGTGVFDISGYEAPDLSKFLGGGGQ